MELRFVLVEPRSEENIGAAARAIKTMGFDQLFLVNPQTILGKVTAYVAHGSEDIVQNIVTVDSLADALVGCDLVVGTTRPNRDQAQPMMSGERLRKYLMQDRSNDYAHVALVFGSERSGLTTVDLNACDILSFIPLAQQRPALNLGQAVMVYSYLLSSIAGGESVVEKITPPALSADERRVLKGELVKVMDELGFSEGHKITKKLMRKVNLFAAHDVRFLHHLVGSFKKRYF